MAEPNCFIFFFLNQKNKIHFFYENVIVICTKVGGGNFNNYFQYLHFHV